MYIIGNILSSHREADKHPEREKKHFHITPDQAKNIDAKGLPLHLEHANNVKVGEVVRSWDDSDGSKWVLGSVDTSDIAGKYVRNDLSSGAPVYTGLSLQHVHREYSDGSATKEGLEVSICKEPRRPGCRIVHASTNPARYKMPDHAQRTMPADNNTTAPANETESSSVNVVANAAAAETSATPSTTQLMAEVVEASRQNEELQMQLTQKNAELQAITERETAAQREALKQQTQVAQKLGDAVLEHVARLDPSLANEDTTTAIQTLREKYPQEIARVMEVACCASKHAQKLEAELARSKEDTDRRLMEQAYHAAVATKTGCHGVSTDEPVSLVHTEAVPASKRARLDGSNPFAVNVVSASAGGASAHASLDTLEQIKAAYSGLKGTGSTADAMKSVAGIISQQRERGFR